MVRAIALVNRLASLPREEGPRRVFDTEWEAAAKAELEGQTWLGRLRKLMEQLEVGLVRDVLPPPQSTSRGSTKRWLSRYAAEVAWPAVRRAEAEEWWNERWSGAAHRQFNRWNSAAAVVETLWNTLQEDGPEAGKVWWEDFEAWVQWRCLGRVDGRRRGSGAVPCAACTVRSGQRGPPETVEHMLAECPCYSEWVLQAIGAEGRSGTPSAIVDRILGAGGPPVAVRAAVHLVGRITRKVRGQAAAAVRIEGTQEAGEWMAGEGAALVRAT